MSERHFPRSGWTVGTHHGTKCGTAAVERFGQTLWRWGEPGKGTVLDDIEDACLLCLAEKVERRLGQGWGLSGERYSRIVTSGR
ncbi:MAG: hypothetical protein H6716_24890 [Polyangiaceae bacterium]|nr:hypothetical protein [Polyangiaceae bacterium]